MGPLDQDLLDIGGAAGAGDHGQRRRQAAFFSCGSELLEDRRQVGIDLIGSGQHQVSGGEQTDLTAGPGAGDQDGAAFGDQEFRAGEA